MENIVYNELLIRGYNVDVGVVDIFDKDKEGKRVRKQLEVDFVVNQGNQRYYIQVAYDMTSEEKQTQEFNSLRNIPDSFKKIVIVNGSKKPWRNEEGFVIMGMKYFLLNAKNQRYYIQVAYDMTSEEKQTQEFNSLRNIPDSFKKIVIVNGSKKPWRNDEGFVIMGMKYFLLNANSLEF
ncbi:putative uncharacterized protein [Firmicutes bacterium CAG:24]|nr:putative uncharacterized protein [Firmicutes bacterium CAG:24]